MQPARRAKRNQKPKHIHVFYGSPRRVLQWSYAHAPMKEQIIKGFCLTSPLMQLSERTKQSPREGIPTWQYWASLFFRSGRLLTRAMYVTPLLSLPTISSLWDFPDPQEREQSMEHCIYNLLLCCTPSLLRWRLLAYRSILFREREHSINVPKEFHRSIVKRRCPGTAICTIHMLLLQRRPNNSPCTVASPNPWGPNPITDVCI